jgi:hypothetical protein
MRIECLPSALIFSAIALAGNVGVAQELRTGVLRNLPPLRFSMGAAGPVSEEQERRARLMLREKLDSAGIAVLPDDEWPPPEAWDLVLEIEGRINAEAGSSECSFMMLSSLTEYAHLVRPIHADDAPVPLFVRATTWRGPRAVGQSSSGQADCWQQFVRVATIAVDKFIADWHAANKSGLSSPGNGNSTE